MNLALQKLQEIRESAAKLQASKTAARKSPSKKVNEDLEVTDDVYVVIDPDTQEVLSDVIASEEEAHEVAQEIADEQGADTMVESISKAKAAKLRKEIREAKAKAARKAPHRSIKEAEGDEDEGADDAGESVGDVEVTDEVWVIKDSETGDIISDVFASEEDALEVAQELADEQGKEVVTESLKVKANKATQKPKAGNKPANTTVKSLKGKK